MRIVSYGKTFTDGVTVDTKLTAGQFGICHSDGTALKTSGRPESFVVMSTVPTKAGGIAIQRGVDINPYNFAFEVRKYDEADVLESLTISGIRNPAANAPAGTVYNADAEFRGKIEIASSQPYRVSPLANPDPQILVFPVNFRATDSLANIKEKIEKAIFLTTYNKELFDVVVDIEGDGVRIAVTAKNKTRLTANLFGVVRDQEADGNVTVKHIKLSGFLNDVALSNEDYRYSAINSGWNPLHEWDGAWGLSDPAQGLSKVAYCVISTAEFNQFPEIAADNNSPRKFQLVVSTDAEIDKLVAKLKAIKALVVGTDDNGIAMNTGAN